jgi:hypothetical protein
MIKIKYHYPDPDEIPDPAQKLPAEFVSSFEPKVREFQKRYRALHRRPEPVMDSDYELVLGDFAIAGLHALAAREQERHADDLLGFQEAIARAGAIAMEYAHWLYHDVEGGRMLFLWQRAVAVRLDGAVKDVEDGWYAEAPDVLPTEPRKAPKEFFVAYRAKEFPITYAQIAARIGVARDTVFKIQEERAWVREDAYEATAQLLGCRPEDLHPRQLLRGSSRGTSANSDSNSDSTGADCD